MSETRISAIIPCYNAACFVTETIKALQNQTHLPDEILVIDDGSSDDSAAIVEALARQDARIRLLRQKNAGGAQARLAGARATSGNLLYFVDADDAPARDALERLEAALRLHPQAVLSYGRAQMTDKTLQPIGAPSPKGPSGAVLAKQLWRNRIMMGSALIRREALRDDSMNHALKVGQDLLMWAQLAACGECIAIGGAPVIYYRKHEMNSTRHARHSPPLFEEMVQFMFDYPPVKTALSPRQQRQLKRRRLAAAYSFIAKTALMQRDWSQARYCADMAMRTEPTNVKLWLLWLASRQRWLAKCAGSFVFR